jgi:dihydrodipicolinate synthase/N-acetylneuraminate lyase
MQYKLGIQSQWYNNERTIVITEVSQPWNWDDVQDNMVNLTQMAESVNHPLGLLVLLPDDLSIPPTGFAQASRKISTNHAAAELHSVVYVTGNRSVKTLWEETIATFAQNPDIYYVVSSMEEALEILGA